MGMPPHHPLGSYGGSSTHLRKPSSPKDRLRVVDGQRRKIARMLHRIMYRIYNPDFPGLQPVENVKQSVSIGLNVHNVWRVSPDNPKDEPKHRSIIPDTFMKHHLKAFENYVLADTLPVLVCQAVVMGKY